MIKLWKDSKKDDTGWAYESDIASNFMKALTSLAYELHLRKADHKVYECFFMEVTNKIKDILHEEELKKIL